MSDSEDFIIDGRPASELRVVDLKEILEKRGLPKTGSKSVLLGRLRESLHAAKTVEEDAPSSADPGYVPNMEMKSCGSNIVAQYLERQQQALLAAKKAAQETRAAKDDARNSSVSSDKSDSVVDNVEQKQHEIIHNADEACESNVEQKTTEKETQNGSSAYSEDTEHIESRNEDRSEKTTVEEHDDKETSVVNDEPSVQETSELCNDDTELSAEHPELSFATESASPPDDDSAKPDQHDQSADERRDDRSVDSDKSSASGSARVELEDASKNVEDDVESGSSPRLRTAGSGNDPDDDDNENDDENVGEDDDRALSGDGQHVNHDPSSDSAGGDVIQLPSLEDDYPLSIDRLLPADDDNDREDSQHSGTENMAVTEKPQKKRRWGSTTVGKRATVSISSDSLKEIVGNVKPAEVALISASLDEGLEEQLDYDDEPVVKRIVVSRDEDGVKERATDSAQHSTAASEDMVDRRHRKRIEFEESAPLLIGDEEYVRVRPPSPARRPPSRIIHVHGLTRPFNFKSWLQFLSTFGAFSNQDDFWIDGIKSHCLVRYASIEEATKAREHLDCIAWPKFNRNSLRAEFAADDDLDRFKKMSSKENGRPVLRTVTSNGAPEHRQRMVREIAGSESMEMDKHVRVLKQTDKLDPWPKTREWDRGKEDWRGGLSPSRMENKPERRPRREISPVQRRQDAKEKVAPAKLLEDLFRKTKTMPFIYWLPLTQEQINEKEKPQKIARRDFEDRPDRFSPPRGRDRPARNFDRDRDSVRYDRQRRR